MISTKTIYFDKKKYRALRYFAKQRAISDFFYTAYAAIHVYFFYTACKWSRAKLHSLKKTCIETFTIHNCSAFENYKN